MIYQFISKNVMEQLLTMPSQIWVNITTASKDLLVTTMCTICTAPHFAIQHSTGTVDPVPTCNSDFHDAWMHMSATKTDHRTQEECRFAARALRD